MSTIESRITSFNLLKEELISHMLSCRTIFRELGKNEMAGTADELMNKTRSDVFKVVVMGNFNAGKSTIINALLGEEVLPTAYVEATAIISEIKYASEKSALVYFKHPLPQPLTKHIPEKIKGHIRKHAGGPIPPYKTHNLEEIDLVAKLPEIEDLKASLAVDLQSRMKSERNSDARDQLSTRLQELDLEKEQVLLEKEMLAAPYEKLEMYWPLDLCKNGVEIIDTPGLNASADREDITRNFMEKADAIIFIFSALVAHSRQEMDVVEDINGMNHTKPIFIINRIDQAGGQEDQAMVMKKAYRVLTPYTELGQEGIFATNARGALDGRREGNRAKLEASGVLKFEEKLAKFLIEDKGRVKLGQPIERLKKDIEIALKQTIPNKRESFAVDLNALESAYANAKPRLDDARRKKGQIVKKISNRSGQLKLDATAVIQKQMEYIRDNIGQWITAMDLESKAKFWDAKKTSSLVIQEIGERLQKTIEAEQEEWSKKVLTPFLNTRVAEIAEEMDYNIQDFCADIDRIKFDLFNADKASYDGPSTAERVSCAIAGFLLMDFGSAIVGGAMGFGAMMKNIGVQIAAIITLMIVGLFNPVTFLAVILGSVVWNMLGGSLTQKIQKKAAEEAKKTMAAHVEEYTGKFVEKVMDKVTQMFGPVEDVLNTEIVSVEEEIHSILESKKKGEQEVQRQKQKLIEFEGRLNKIYSDIDRISMRLNA
ncbi:MAG: GTP-binding protein HSR1-related protein [Paenibacillaceae bacterium]|jgi:GTPase SAR1 family protein|nr:GTP-binding protein HSR1-related protein [Paenibacillaceae bacterium]